MHQQTDKKLKFFLYFFIFIFLSTVNNFSFIKNKELLSKVKSIEVVGLSKNLNSIVKKKFDSLIDNNIFTLNKENLENDGQLIGDTVVINNLKILERNEFQKEKKASNLPNFFEILYKDLYFLFKTSDLTILG